MDLTQQIAALRASPAFRDVSERVLRRICTAGAIVTRARGEVIYRQGAPADGFYVITSGEAHLYREGAGERHFLFSMSAGACAGEVDCLAQKPRPATLIASADRVEFLFFSTATIETVIGTSTALRRTLHEVDDVFPTDPAYPGVDEQISEPRVTSPIGGPVAATAPAPAKPPLTLLASRAWNAEVVIFEADPALAAELGGQAPEPALIELVAQAITRDFGDRVLIIRVVDAAAPLRLVAWTGPNGVRFVDVTIAQARSWRSQERTSFALDQYDYIFLDATPLGPARRAAVMAAFAEEGLLHTRVDLCRYEELRTSPARKSVTRSMRAIFLPPERISPPAVAAARARVKTFFETLGAATEPHTEDPVDSTHVDCCHVRLDLAALARAPRGDDGHLEITRACAALDAARPAGARDPSAAEHLSRWARAITQRQVGVALGGGGAWGFAHVLLMQRMIEQKIPIDLVSGTSFGSVAGAYFCGRPGDGLDLLRKRTHQLQGVSLRAIVSTNPLADLVNRDLDGALLEELSVRFFPVAADLRTGSKVVIMSGPVGFGVRASSSLPGLWGPTTSRRARFVDGCIVDNVPVAAVASRGADLVIASNVVPAPAPHDEGDPRVPGGFGRFLHEANPYHRSVDMVRALFVLIHRTGDLSASGAHVRFDAGPTSHEYDVGNFTKAEEIIDSARPAVEATIKEIEAAWRKLKSDSRIERTGAPSGGTA